MKEVWFTSDYHLGHKNILHLCQRPFADVEQMAQMIVQRHNACVKPDDTVYDLGDFAFRCSAEYAAMWMAKLHGNRHLILGNHDKPLRQAYRRGLLDNLLAARKLTLIGEVDSRLQTSARINIDGQGIIVSHYAQRTWHGAFRGAWHLFGHSHGNLLPLHKSIDVGVDAHDFRPVSFTTLKARMDRIDEAFTET